VKLSSIRKEMWTILQNHLRLTYADVTNHMQSPIWDTMGIFLGTGTKLPQNFQHKLGL